jgi:hypothetical protein
MKWIVDAELIDIRGAEHRVDVACVGDTAAASVVALRRLAPAMGFAVAGCRVGFRAEERVLPFGTRLVTSYGGSCRLIADTGRGDAWVSYGAGGVTGLFVKAMRCELRTLDEVHDEALTYYGALLDQRHAMDHEGEAWRALAPRS